MVTIPNFSESWKGPIIIIGFGSIGKALLPLICRHLKFDTNKIYIIDPNDKNKEISDKYGATFLKEALSESNFKEILGAIIHADTNQSLIINVSVDVATKDIIRFAQETNCLSIDTSIDPWAGFYFNEELSLAERSNYALRENLLELRESSPSKTTAVSCCGANPGMVSWLVKQALLNIAKDTGLPIAKPVTREEWGSLMQRLNVKGIHIAERDTQQSLIETRSDCFLNTWSVEGFLFESLQPAELGWGTHEKQLPLNGIEHDYGCKAAIYINTPAVGVHVQTWTPSTGNHHAFLVTHNEAISISDYFTVRDRDKVVYRPTCHYAYRPSDATIVSLNEVIKNNYKPLKEMHVLEPNEIQGGMDELGVLIYGHAKNAYWFGSQLSIEEARELVPHQNATGLQVASALIAGIIWAIRHPEKGLVEVDEMDFEECLDLQKPYLGQVSGYYTDWNPLKSIVNGRMFKDDDDPWQFSNIRT